jgi:hypothetical protein
MTLTGSHWNKGGVGAEVTSEGGDSVTLKLDTGHTEEIPRDELIRDWVRVTSPAESRGQ